MELPEFVSLAASAGFGGADVDLAWAVEHGENALADLYAGHKMSFGGWGPRFDWRGDNRNQKDDLAGVAAQAKIASKLGIDSCCTWLLPSSVLALHQNWHFHVMRLAPIAKVLGEHGLKFGLEFVAPYHLRRKWKHEFVFTPMAVLELAGDVGPNVGLLVDCFHLHAAGEPMDVIRRIPADKIVLVHLNDAPTGRLEEVEDGKRVLPGEGVIDLKQFFAELNAVGYRGPISLEVFSEKLKALPAEEAARRAWIATRSVINLK